jgi:hypothetical protein
MDDSAVNDHGVYTECETIVIPGLAKSWQCYAEIRLVQGNDRLWRSGMEYRHPTGGGGGGPSVSDRQTFKDRSAAIRHECAAIAKLFGSPHGSKIQQDKMRKAADAVLAYAAEFPAVPEPMPAPPTLVEDWQSVGVHDLELPGRLAGFLERLGYDTAGKLDAWMPTVNLDEDVPLDQSLWWGKESRREWFAKIRESIDGLRQPAEMPKPTYECPDEIGPPPGSHNRRALESIGVKFVSDAKAAEKHDQFSSDRQPAGPPGAERTPRGLETPWLEIPVTALEKHHLPKSTIDRLLESKIRTIGDLMEREKKATGAYINVDTISVSRERVKGALQNLSAARARGEDLLFETAAKPTVDRTPEPKTEKLLPYIVLHGPVGGPYEQVVMPGGSPGMPARSADDAFARAREAIGWQVHNLPDGIVLWCRSGGCYRIAGKSAELGGHGGWLEGPGWTIEEFAGQKPEIRGANETLIVLGTGEPRFYEVVFRGDGSTETLTTVKAMTKPAAQALAKHWLARYRPRLPDWRLEVRPIEAAKAERKASRREKSKRQLAGVLGRETEAERKKRLALESRPPEPDPGEDEP